MALCGGIDLHSNNSVISIIDSQDRVISEKRLPNELPLIRAHLAPHRALLASLAVESTYNWYWLVDGRQANRFVSNHAAVQNLFNLGRHLVGAQHYRDLRISAFNERGQAVA
jgi:hypothetical protein